MGKGESAGVLPRRIGRWKIERQLGAGGMGRVYLGRHGNDVAAVKVVHAGLATDPQFRARFRREVAVTRRAAGRFVASVVDADPDATEPWLAIRYIDGPTLAQAVNGTGPLRTESVVATAVALASALRDIHAVGVQHRDLKPANVILSSDGPVVIDFGIAAATDATALTSTGAVMGSAGWMAPEQIRGEKVGAEADVFAWAATVCFAATGRSPFGTGRADAVAYRVAHEPPDLDGVPSEVLDLVSRSLDKVPERRPSVPEVLEELSAVIDGLGTVLDGRPVEDAVTTMWSAPRWDTSSAARSRRPPVALVVAAVVAIVAIAGGAAWWIASDELPPEEVVADVDGTTSTDGATTTSVLATTASTTTTSTTSAPPATTTAPPTTLAPTTTTPPVPALERAFDPGSDPDVTAFVDFAQSHLQTVVRLNVSWMEGEPPTVDAQPDWEPGTGIVYVPGACLDYPYCGGMEILVRDLASVPDANLYYDSGAWVLSGRFVVQSVIASNGGVMSVALRAVPAA